MQRLFQRRQPTTANMPPAEPASSMRACPRAHGADADAIRDAMRRPDGC
ncbi:hypothetical protein GJV26_21330 [Massilia dura]|uniref:Uncharacterized protein n=1 Tax=Pseudoduganella dura TaxID=321982 RepID=A0A6I3XR28_9BURK|nr:hypothetical protein [Pseudoduganella dura]MUI14988.1 hypothetical protein [Pseudoduganella dura]